MSLLKNLFILIIGALLGATAIYFVKLEMLPNITGMNELSTSEEQPLYWVAPMDPNYRRDAPGKSPMGMDLIPVYAKDQNSDDSPGTIEITPEIINNLGVRTAQARLGTLQTEVRTVGYLQYNQDSIVHIHPRIEGWIEKSHVTSVGDPVQKDQPLYTLYSPALVNAQEELLFGLRRQDARMVQAAEDRLRALKLSDRFIQQLKTSGQVSQTVTFYAPISGVIDNLNIREGFYVQPGMTLFSIANLDQIWLEAEVLERQAGLIQQGLPVEIWFEGVPGKVHVGQVDYVYPTLDDKTRTLRVRVRLDNPNHTLKPNMFAELKITAQDEQDRLLIPKEAVIRSGYQDRVVMALGEGRFKSIAIATGQRDGGYVEVLDGLQSGEHIVTSAQFLLDSESSKTSDFTRIDAESAPKTDTPNQVWAEIKVNSIAHEDRKVNVDHGAIEAWAWPSMTMDFQLSESLESSKLKPGLIAHAQITRTPEKTFEISDLHIPDSTEDSAISNMNSPQTTPSLEAVTAKADRPKKVWVRGVVQRINAAEMTINAQHDAIPEWNWPEMTMDFQLDEFVDLDELKTDQPLHLEITRTDDNGYIVTDFFLAEAE